MFLLIHKMLCNFLGRNNVWCLYPNKNTPIKSVEDILAGYISNNLHSEPNQVLCVTPYVVL